MKDSTDFQYEKIDGFTITALEKPHSMDIKSILINEAYLITNTGIEWANNKFVVHKDLKNGNEWRVSHKETGVAVAVNFKNIEDAISKCRRILNEAGKENYDKAVERIKRIQEYAVLGNREEFDKIKKGYVNV